MTLLQGLVGPQTGTDNTNMGLRQGRDGTVVVQSGHGDYTELTFRGKTWSLLSGAVTIAATNDIGSTGPATPLVAIYNPVSSGVNAWLLAVSHTWASGTAAAGGLILGILPAATITAAGGNGAISLSSGVIGGSKCSTFVNAAVTGQSAAYTAADYVGGPTTGALAANSESFYRLDYRGVVCCPPGASVGLFSAGTGTSPIVYAGMIWSEENVNGAA